MGDLECGVGCQIGERPPGFAPPLSLGGGSIQAMQSCGSLRSSSRAGAAVDHVPVGWSIRSLRADLLQRLVCCSPAEYASHRQTHCGVGSGRKWQRRHRVRRGEYLLGKIYLSDVRTRSKILEDRASKEKNQSAPRATTSVRMLPSSGTQYH